MSENKRGDNRGKSGVGPIIESPNKYLSLVLHKPRSLLYLKHQVANISVTGFNGI
jgi:hypothetical protein